MTFTIDDLSKIIDEVKSDGQVYDLTFTSIDTDYLVISKEFRKILASENLKYYLVFNPRVEKRIVKSLGLDEKNEILYQIYLTDDEINKLIKLERGY